MIKLIIPQPVPYFSQEDENHFFRWLKRIKAVQGNIVGSKHGLHLTLSDPVDDDSLYDLIALLKRYSVDMRCLATLCTPANESWFRSSRKYWYRAIFGRRRKPARVSTGSGVRAKGPLRRHPR